MDGPIIGVLAPYLSGPYYGPIVSAILRAASLSGAGVAAVQTAGPAHHFHHSTAGELVGRVGWGRVAGLVTIANPVSTGYLKEFQATTGKPVVAIGHEEPGFACPSVTTDNRGGVALAVEHLRAHGHSRIGFVGALDLFDTRERYESYLSTMRAHGAEPLPELFFETLDSVEQGGQSAAQAMLAAGLPASAVVVATDLSAIGLILTLKAAGLSLPRDLAVVGFDNMPGCGLQSPSLSSISQDFDQLGTKAVDLMMRLLRGEGPEEERLVLPARFVARQSCGCVGAGRAVAVGDGAGGDGAGRDGAGGEGAERAALSLARASFFERNDAYYSLRQAIRDEYEITLDLMSRDGDPASLKWLSMTGACLGLLALWSGLGEGDIGPPGGRGAGDGDATEDPHHELEVTGTFVADGYPLDPAWAMASSSSPSPPSSSSPSSTCPVELFPPAEFFEAAGTGSFVSVFPVKSMSTDWGFLAVASPISSGLVGQDSVFMWSAMFSEALDHRALTRSLSRRGEDLARSYEREKEMAQAVRESEERYALAAQAANDGLWDWDLARGTVYYSPRWKEMLGYPGTGIGDKPEEWLRRVHPDDRAGLSSALSDLKKGRHALLINEHRVRAADGHYKWALCRGLAVPGTGAPATRIVGSLTDVTERHLLEERLRHQALFDSLTGLPNRVLFMDRLAQAVANARRHPAYTYTVLWLDLDNFKNLNDSLGHQFGDKLLVQVADRIRVQLREPDTAARFGGDEFALLLLDVPDFASVQAIVRRLLDSLLAPYQLEGHEVVVTASLGVATSTTAYDCPEDVLRDADIAMYRAKSTARGSYATFDESMHASAVARQKTETELRQAVESSVHRNAGSGSLFPSNMRALFANGPALVGGVPQGGPGADIPGSYLELHYQPVTDLGTGAVEAMEALVRWRHLTRGLVPAFEFVTVAEDSGLIVPMGRWVMDRACRQMVAWHVSSVPAPGTRVSINLSNREFWDPRFLDHFDRVLIETGAPSDLIALEINESVIMEDVAGAAKVLSALRARRVQVHVDDFGTGYSSLEALHRLPIDFLKIDRSFVARLGDDDRTADLVRTIVQLGQSIGVGVIAVGVATTEQHRILLDIGCRLGQGFLFAAALPPDALEELLARGPRPFAGAATGPAGGHF